MTAIGADPEALDTLAAELRRSAARFDQVASRLAASVDRAGWTGPDADRFGRDWRLHLRPRLRDSAASCSALAARLSAQSADQVRASSSPGRVGSAALGAPPTRTETWSGRIQAGHGVLSASASGSLTLEQLASGQVRVTAGSTAGAGATASAGDAGSVTLGGSTRAAGTSAGATVQGEGTERRTWTVPATAVRSLLAGLALEGTVVGLPFRVVDGAAAGLGGVLDALGIDNDLGHTATFPLLPEPDRVEHLVGVSVGASYVAGASAAPGGTASVTAQVAAGTASDRLGRRSVVVEETATGSTALTAGLGQALGVRLGPAGPQHADVVTRIEVPVDAGARDPRPVLVTVRVTGAGEQVLTRVAVDRDAAGDTVDGLLRFVRDVAAGDPSGAAHRLARHPVADGAVAVQVSTASVQRDGLGLSVSGTGGSLTPEGTRTVVTPDG
jgi:hypothetical protein